MCFFFSFRASSIHSLIPSFMNEKESIPLPSPLLSIFSSLCLFFFLFFSLLATLSSPIPLYLLLSMSKLRPLSLPLSLSLSSATLLFLCVSANFNPFGSVAAWQMLSSGLFCKLCLVGCLLCCLFCGSRFLDAGLPLFFPRISYDLPGADVAHRAHALSLSRQSQALYSLCSSFSTMTMVLLSTSFLPHFFSLSLSLPHSSSSVLLGIVKMFTCSFPHVR